MERPSTYAHRSAPLALALAWLLCATGASAQMYKWTDAKGVVHYSDQPPTGKERKVELKLFGGSADPAALPPALAEAAKNHPVTLYTTADCTACDQGRALLRARGIPFAEKTVTSGDDQQKLKEAGSAGRLPLLLVGASKRIGFEADAWSDTLSAAAYPLEKMLPPNYQYPLAQSAAPAPVPTPARAARSAVQERAVPERVEPVRSSKVPPAPGTPPGFQF